MPATEKVKIATLRPSCFIMLHFGLGMELRNGLPIWGNDALLKDAKADHPDEVSGIIMARYQRRLYERLPSDYRARIEAFEVILNRTSPAIARETTMAAVVEIWNSRFREALSGTEAPKVMFEMRITGSAAKMKAPPDLFHQKSVADFLDQEGVRFGLIYFEGDVLKIDSPNQD